MTSPSVEKFQDDAIALRIACALALANEAASAHDANPSESSITVSEAPSDQGPVWCVYYGPRGASSRMRGGDLTVYVDWDATAVLKVLYGQ